MIETILSLILKSIWLHCVHFHMHCLCSEAWSLTNPAVTVFCCVAVFYASMCDVLTGDVFVPCHAYVSPGVYYQQCRYQACRCGSACLCSALAHYAYICSKHHIIINFRAHVSECGEFIDSPLCVLLLHTYTLVKPLTPLPQLSNYAINTIIFRKPQISQIIACITQWLVPFIVNSLQYEMIP